MRTGLCSWHSPTESTPCCSVYLRITLNALITSRVFPSTLLTQRHIPMNTTYVSTNDHRHITETKHCLGIQRRNTHIGFFTSLPVSPRPVSIFFYHMYSNVFYFSRSFCFRYIVCSAPPWPSPREVTIPRPICILSFFSRVHAE